MKKENYLEFGNVVELKNGDLCLIEPQFNYGSDETVEMYLKEGSIIQLRDIRNAKYVTDLNRYNDDLTNKSFDEFSIVKVYKDHSLKEVLWTRENGELLTSKEKNWLIEVIKIFSKKPDSIVKLGREEYEFLRINIDDNYEMDTPYFPILNFKFENLKTGIEYSLKELGLFKGE